MRPRKSVGSYRARHRAVLRDILPLEPCCVWRERMPLAVYSAAVGAMSAMLVVQHVTSEPVMTSNSVSADVVVAESGADGGSIPLYPEYPDKGSLPLPAAVPDMSGALGGSSQAVPVVQGIPTTVLHAYQRATDNMGTEKPGCHLPLPLLAAIGRVESGHARGGNVDAEGTTRSLILGPRLNGGPGVAAIHDTDGGVYDRDTVWDRAVGSMQFIPSTWRRWAADGNADGVASPHNVFDAALAAGRYLCAAGGDVATANGLRRAILAYNHSESYLNLVLAWMRLYAGGTTAMPDTLGPVGDTSEGGAEQAGYRDASPRENDTGPASTQPAVGPVAKKPAPAPSPSPAPPADGAPGDGAGGAVPWLPSGPSLPAPSPSLPAAPSAIPVADPRPAG